jgi:CBS domain-containing protein
MVETNPLVDISSMFPEGMELAQVPPEMLVCDALTLMLEKQLTHIAVVDHGLPAGVFSQRSLARHLSLYPKMAIDDLAVEDVAEQVPEMTVRSPYDLILENINRHGSVLITSPHGVQGVATHQVVANYLATVARPYVLLQEIELRLRSVIAGAVPPDDLGTLLESSLRGKYEAMKKPVPDRLDRLTFDDYPTLIASNRSWGIFAKVLGGPRALASTKLENVGRIRNDVFHFRGTQSLSDFEALVNTRDWLARRRPAQGAATSGDSQ